MSAHWAAAKHELHEHETLIFFSDEAKRNEFVSNGGGVAGGHIFRDARKVSGEEAAYLGGLHFGRLAE